MAWQDELNSLDEELSSGRIRTEEYRKRRDELLAAASSNPVGVRRIHRKQPPSIANAFTGDAKSDEREAEVTQQVFLPVDDPASPSWGSQPPADTDDGQRPTSPPARIFARTASVPKQGPEVFGLAVADRSKSRRWPRFVIAVAVLAVAAGAIWWLIGSSGPAPIDSAANQPPATTAAGSPEILAKLPKLPGEPIGKPAMLPVSVGAQLGLYSPNLAREVENAGGLGLANVATADGTANYVISALSAKEFTAPLAGILGYHSAAGWKNIPDGKLPKSVQVLQAQTPGQQNFRAIYQSGEWTVIVSGSAITSDRQKFLATFEGVVTTATAALPTSN